MKCRNDIFSVGGFPKVFIKFSTDLTPKEVKIRIKYNLTSLTIMELVAMYDNRLPELREVEWYTNLVK